MLAAISHLNWLSVLTASVAHFMLGGIWFAVLFGKHYATALGIAHNPVSKPKAIFFIGPLICSSMNIVTTAFLMRALYITTYNDALALGAIIGFGYLAPMTVNIAINPLFPRPFYYAMINVPMFVVGSLMSSAILLMMS